MNELQRYVDIQKGILKADDEFYTRREDIDAMLPEWDLSDKIVYCCADSEESEFVKYFKQPGKCKELIYTSDDFRTHRDLFEKCDIVVTNPPFSLIRVLVRMIYAAKKDFILIQPVLPTLAVPTGRGVVFEQILFFKRLNDFNREKTVLCQWTSTLGTKEHPCGYSFKELFGKDYKVCENWEEAPVVATDPKGAPIRKYGKRTGFPPKDFTGYFIVTSDNNCSDFLVSDVGCYRQTGFRFPKNVLGNLSKWRRK